MEKDMGWFLVGHPCDCTVLANIAVNNRSIRLGNLLITMYMGDYQLFQQYPADRRLLFRILSHVS